MRTQQKCKVKIVQHEIVASVIRFLSVYTACHASQEMEMELTRQVERSTLWEVEQKELFNIALIFKLLFICG